MKFLLFNILFIASSAFGSTTQVSKTTIVKVELGPPKITQEEEDANDKLWDGICKSFPILTTLEIGDCIRYVRAHPEVDLIQECQEFMFWKLMHKEELAKKVRMYDTCFKEYKSSSN